VLESFGERFENGGVEHRFLVSKNLPPVKIYGSQPILGPTTNFDWAHGPETYTRQFNNSGQTLVENRNVLTVDSRITNNFPGLIMCRNYQDQGYFCSQAFGFSVFDALTYDVQQRWLHSDSSLTITYDQNDLSKRIVKWSANAYDNTFHTLPSKIFSDNSLNETVYRKVKYVQDYSGYANNAVLNNLFTAHAINLPIEELIIKRNRTGRNLF